MIKKRYPLYYTFPALILFGIFFMLPVVSSFMFSFTNWNINRLFTPKFNGLKNFKYLFTDEYFFLALKNTVLFACLTTGFIVLLGLFLSVLLREGVYGKKFFRTIFYLPAVLSLIVVGIVFSSVLKMNGGILNQILDFLNLGQLKRDWLGNPDTAMGWIMFVQVWKWSGFAMAIYLAGIQGIPKDYYEAAIIDGANKWRQFKEITYPLLASSLTIVVTMNLIGGFKVFEQVYIMTGGGPGNATQVLGTYVYQEFSKGNLGRSTAMGLVLFLIITVISSVVNRKLRQREVEF